jgi:hypothetical protein
MSAGNILFLRIEAVSSLCAVVASAGGTLVEENIDAATFEQLATMPLISVCLDYHHV